MKTELISQILTSVGHTSVSNLYARFWYLQLVTVFFPHTQLTSLFIWILNIPAPVCLSSGLQQKSFRAPHLYLLMNIWIRCFLTEICCGSWFCIPALKDVLQTSLCQRPQHSFRGEVGAIPHVRVVVMILHLFAVLSPVATLFWWTCVEISSSYGVDPPQRGVLHQIGLSKSVGWLKGKMGFCM